MLVWALGFAWFAILLPQPLDPARKTDAIVVLTGGPGRIARGVHLLGEGAAKRMLISGVDRAVRPHELASQADVPDRLFECCVTLGREAIDTRSNGVETARWLDRMGYDTVRLITTDWHMRRATFELKQALPRDIVVFEDAVPSEPGFGTLFTEYNKYVLRRTGALLGI